LLSLIVVEMISGASFIISCKIYDFLNSDTSCLCALLIQLVFGAAIIYAIAFYGTVLWSEDYRIGSVIAWACAIASSLWASALAVVLLSAFVFDICRVKK